MTEDALQRQIVQYLAIVLPRGWMVQHTANKPRSAIQGAREKAMGAVAGWPDITVIGRDFVGFLEVKAPKGVLSAKQREVHETLRALGHRVAVVRSCEDVSQALALWGVATKEHSL